MTTQSQLAPRMQQERVLVAVVYAGLLVITYWLVAGRLLPPFGAQGTWFYGGLAILLLSVALQEPFFTTPANSLLNATALLIAAVAFPTTAGSQLGLDADTIERGKILVALAAGLLLATGLGAIFAKDSDGSAGRLSEPLMRMSSLLGNARVVYSIVYLLGLFAVSARDPAMVGWMTFAWILIVIARPIERGLDLIPYLRRKPGGARAVVIGLRSPGLVELRSNQRSLSPGDWLRTADGKHLSVLDTYPAPDGAWVLATAQGQLPEIGTGATKLEVEDGEASVMPIGAVEPGTDLENIRVRVPADISTVEEGNLLRVMVRRRPVLYQIVAAVARREQIGGPVEHRFVEMTARKIGSWDHERKAFTPEPWLPPAGAAVELVQPIDTAFAADSVGHVPKTNFGVRVDIHPLVTHNTAILGILGVGKTFLVFELIRRMIAARTRVLVIDITGQYANHFRDLVPQGYESATYDMVDGRIAGRATAVEQSKQLGGNHRQFSEAIKRDLGAFLKSPFRLKIYDPARFHVTRQTTNPYQNQAAMAGQTVVEVTRLIVEALLELLQEAGTTQEAKMCVVLEEAHSLVPEWNSASYDGDQQAAAGTAKAVLQARKYGLGTLIVTQRTANVTKTILNQCHTVFAMRSFDATGMEFLRNYIGSDYVGTLSTLPERHAVVFGRASSCPTPVIVQVNDHDAMMEGFWNPGLNVPSPRVLGEHNDACGTEGCFGTVDWFESPDSVSESGDLSARCSICGTVHVRCGDCGGELVDPDHDDPVCVECGIAWILVDLQDGAVMISRAGE